MHARILIGAAALAASITVAAHGQVAEQNWPSSYLNVDLGGPGGTTWSGWTLFGSGYGAGSNNQGASGYIAHNYDFASNLTSIVVTIDELRNTGGPFIATNSPYARTTGQVLFTPLVGMAYTISGAVWMQLDGASISNTLTTGAVGLEVLSGPSLATYSGGVFRSGAGGFGAAGSIFNSATPTSGASTGFLNAGTTYRLSWDFIISSTMNNDATLSGNVSTPQYGSFLQISFAVPAPGAAATAALAGLAVLRRRRA
ncbi:MAG: hypothetical protein KIT68_11600 [Phycisphaeraceae bacterium]|nr:hypothetical protein [Phycisphaeraceae bacterium]